MKRIWLCFAAFTAAVVTAVATVTYFSLAAADEEERQEERGMLAGAEPTAPNFNAADNAECIATVSGYYDRALTLFNYVASEKKKLADSYAAVLAEQAASGQELVNNRAFLDWTVADWPSSWLGQRGEPLPDFSKEVLEAFMPSELGKPPAQNLRTTEELEKAVEVLYRWLVNWGLQDGVLTLSLIHI